MMGVKSKPYDAEVEYLESSEASGGHAFVNTGYVPDGNDITIHCGFTFLGVPPNQGYCHFFGAGTGGMRRYRACNYGGLNIIIGDVDSARVTGGKIPVVVNERYDIKLCSETYMYDVNGISGELSPYNSTAAANTYPMLLFQTSSMIHGSYGKMYYFKLWKGGKSILDMVPVRVGSEGFMYDKVSGKLFGNSGTGRFILGPDIS